MIIRFTLDSVTDAKLIAKILARKGKKSASNVARQMMQEYSYHEDMFLKRQKLTADVSNSGQESESDDINLDELDNINLEF